jgi:hypothetical protein
MHIYREDRKMIITKNTYLKKTALTEQHVLYYQRKDNMYKVAMWFVKLVRYRQKSCWNTFNDVKWHIGIFCVGSPCLTLYTRRLIRCNARFWRPKIR